jgi:hypothetical protein
LTDRSGEAGGDTVCIAYTIHARVQAEERGISSEDIQRAIRSGQRTVGKANKTILTDTRNNIAVVAVGLSKSHWLVITAYRLVEQRRH